MKLNSTVILPTAYNPSIFYFVLLNSYKNVLIEIYDHYTKQTYRNRCIILSPNGKIVLSVAVKKGNEHKIKLNEVEPDYTQGWVHNHLKAIETTYYPTPFFDIIYPDIKKIINHQYKYLFELNEQLLLYYLDILQIETNYSYTNEYFESSETVKDFRENYHPKKEYITKYNFLETPYYQTFSKNNFISELSIIDLLFHLGSEAGKYIRELSKCYKQSA